MAVGFLGMPLAMTTRGSIATTFIAIAVAGTLAGCSGSSSGGGTESNATVCQKLASDAQSFDSTVQSAKTPSAAESALDAAASKFQADASNASDATLRSGVDKLVSVIRTAANAAKSGQTPNLASLGSQIQSAESDLKSTCPNLGSS
jgi:hypothetical protein